MVKNKNDEGEKIGWKFGIGCLMVISKVSLLIPIRKF